MNRTCDDCGILREEHNLHYIKDEKIWLCGFCRSKGDLYHEYDISFCIPTFNRLESLISCLSSIKRINGLFSYEIVIADGGSTDGTIEYLESRNISFIPNAKGLTASTMQCVHKAKGNLIFIINDDMTIVPSTIKKCIDLFKANPLIHFVAPKMIELRYDRYPNVQVDKNGFVLSKICIVRRSTFKKLNYWDIRFQTYLVDVDLHLNFLDNGYTTCASRDVGVIHSRSKKNRGRYVKMNREVIDYYNSKWGKFKPQMCTVSFYFMRCLNCRLLRFLMNNQNKAFMKLYDYTLDKRSRFSYKKMNGDFYLFQHKKENRK